LALEGQIHPTIEIDEKQRDNSGKKDVIGQPNHWDGTTIRASINSMG